MILLAGIMLIGMLFGLVSQPTGAAFSDPEAADNNAMAIAASIAQTLIDDGFEGEPWDANWDGNGTTTWQRETQQVHGGQYSVGCDKRSRGFLTIDDLDASWAASITVSFWFRANIDTDHVFVQLHNSSQYNTWYDLRNYSSYVDNQWCYFSEVLTDSQYFKSNFRLRFDSSGVQRGNEVIFIDDVAIQTE